MLHPRICTRQLPENIKCIYLTLRITCTEVHRRMNTINDYIWVFDKTNHNVDDNLVLDIHQDVLGKGTAS